MTGITSITGIRTWNDIKLVKIYEETKYRLDLLLDVRHYEFSITDDCKYVIQNKVYTSYFSSNLMFTLQTIQKKLKDKLNIDSTIHILKPETEQKYLCIDQTNSEKFLMFLKLEGIL